MRDLRGSWRVSVLCAGPQAALLLPVCPGDAKKLDAPDLQTHTECRGNTLGTPGDAVRAEQTVTGATERVRARGSKGEQAQAREETP